MQSDYGTIYVPSDICYTSHQLIASSWSCRRSHIWSRTKFLSHRIARPYFLKLAFAQHRITQHMTSTRSAIYYSTTELALVLEDEDVSLRLPRVSVMRPGLKFVLHQCTNYQVWSSQAFPYREWLIFDHGVKRPDWPFYGTAWCRMSVMARTTFLPILMVFLRLFIVNLWETYSRHDLLIDITVQCTHVGDAGSSWSSIGIGAGGTRDRSHWGIIPQLLCCSLI